MKLKKGDRVKFVDSGRKTFKGTRKGVVVGFPKGMFVRVLPDGLKTPITYGQGVWEKQKKAAK